MVGLPMLPFQGLWLPALGSASNTLRAEERDGGRVKAGDVRRASRERELSSLLPLGQASPCTHFCGIWRRMFSSWRCQNYLPEICSLNISKVYKRKEEVMSCQ